MKIVPASPNNVALAVEFLQQGKLVVIPTETVYGLAADALNPVAVERIFAAKGRPSENPLIVHIAGREDLQQVARSVPPLAMELAKRFWPGPLTLVLPKQPEVPGITTAG